MAKKPKPRQSTAAPELCLPALENDGDVATLEQDALPRTGQLARDVANYRAGSRIALIRADDQGYIVIIEGADDEIPVVDSDVIWDDATPEPQIPSVATDPIRTVTIDAPLTAGKGYAARRLRRDLTRERAITLRDLTAGLNREGVKVEVNCEVKGGVWGAVIGVYLSSHVTAPPPQ